MCTAQKSQEINCVAIKREVAPAHPAAPYIGGKKQLAARLCTMIETTPHDLYAEAFVGMGGVFLRRKGARA